MINVAVEKNYSVIVDKIIVEFLSTIGGIKENERKKLLNIIM